MQVVDIRVKDIHAAEWNPNSMDAGMIAHLRRSIQKFGLVVPLVVRDVTGGIYETVGGAQRLAVLQETGAETAPCVVVKAGDAEARLLAQALNHLAGRDDPGLRAALLRQVIETLSEREVLGILPESAEGLRELASVTADDLAGHMRAWQQAQAARLKHMTFQLLPAQVDPVEKALDEAMKRAGDRGSRRRRGAKPGSNPNARGNALYDICKAYLEDGGAYTRTYTRKAK